MQRSMKTYVGMVDGETEALTGCKRLVLHAKTGEVARRSRLHADKQPREAATQCRQLRCFFLSVVGFMRLSIDLEILVVWHLGPQKAAAAVLSFSERWRAG
jgi:hypothetical protein